MQVIRWAFIALAATATSAMGGVLATRTISNATHYGYYGFSSTSANNTKTFVGPYTGRAKVIKVNGTLTKVHPDAWAKSLRVLPSGGGLAGFQPHFQFSNLYDFEGTIPVSSTIYAPGGVNLSGTMVFEMYSIDDEGFVPGVDGRSTLTYTFEDTFAPGTAEYTGTIATTDPTFNRPVQVESSGPSGYSAPFLTNRFPHYDVQPFHVSTAGSYSMVTANEFESAGVLYANSFNPATPLTNLVLALGQTGNVLRNNTFNSLPAGDDATGGTLITRDLVPGVQYYFVTTAYTNPGGAADGGPFIGRYSNVITGAGQVNLGIIPEPGSLTLLAALATGWRRRRPS